MYIRCFGLACLVLLSMIGGQRTANAADLYRAPPPPPVSYVPPVIATNTWTGFYAGINGGYGWGSGGNTISYFDGLDQSARAQPQGGFGGGQIGYNYQTGSFVFGVETDFQGAGISNSVTGTTANGFDFTSKESIDWFGTARGRLGFAVGNALLYGTGGFAYGNVNQRASNDVQCLRKQHHADGLRSRRRHRIQIQSCLVSQGRISVYRSRQPEAHRQPRQHHQPARHQLPNGPHRLKLSLRRRRIRASEVDRTHFGLRGGACGRRFHFGDVHRLLTRQRGGASFSANSAASRLKDCGVALAPLRRRVARP